MKLNNCGDWVDWEDCENDWGLFVVLDEEEKKQVNYKKMLLKNIIQIETIEEGDCEYYLEEAGGNKMEYYRNTAGFGDRDQDRDQDVEDRDQDQDQDVEDYKNIVKDKIQFLLTYMFTASVSMALIILTFTV